MTGFKLAMRVAMRSPMRTPLRRVPSGAAALQPLDYILLVGSSTTVQSFTLNPILGRQEQSARASFAAQGIDIPIINKAVAGSTLADLDANISTYLADAAFTGKNIGVHIHSGANNIGQVSYAAMSQATKDAMAANLNSIVTKTNAAGANFFPFVTTSNSQKTFESMYLDWATNFYAPIIAARTPSAQVAGLPAFDYAQFYYDNRNVTNWWNADNVHPWMATVPLQVYLAQQLKKIAAPTALSAKEKFLFKFDNASIFVGGVNTITGAGTQNLASVINNRAVVVAGVSYGYTGMTGVGNTVRAGVGNYDIGISNLEFQKWYAYTSGGNNVHTLNLGVAYANRTGVARCTFNTSNSGRQSRYTIGATSADITGNAAGLQTVSIPFTANASGVVVLTVSPASGSFASINAVEFEVD